MLSVIIPVYNGEKYIEETIKSIQESEYTDLEILIVNDGSSDNSLKIMTELQKSDVRIVIYNKSNGGVVTARNYGVERARGEYICFADQDDFVKPFMYSKMIQRMEEDVSDMAICSSGRSINGQETGYEYQKDAVYTDENICTSLLFPILFNGYDVPINIDRTSHYSHIWTCIFRASFWRDNNISFRSYINFEDDLLVKVEALSKAKKVSTISDIGYFWRVNMKSESYAHHYIENIGIKQEQCYQDMLSNLKRCCSDPDILHLFMQVTYCKQYIEAVHYLASPELKPSKEFILQYFEKNIYVRNFNEAIKGRNYLMKGRVKPRILLPLLERRKSLFCYYIEKKLDLILLLSLRSNTLTKLERKLKNK